MNLLRRGVIKAGGAKAYNALTAVGGVAGMGTVLNTGAAFEVEFEMEVIASGPNAAQSVLGRNLNAITNFKVSYTTMLVQLAWGYGTTDISSVSITGIGDVGGTGWHKYKLVRGASSAQAFIDDDPKGTTSYISNTTSNLDQVLISFGQASLFSSNIKIRNLKVTQGGVTVDMSLNGNFNNAGTAGNGTTQGVENTDYQFI